MQHPSKYMMEVVLDESDTMHIVGIYPSGMTLVFILYCHMYMITMQVATLYFAQ